MIIKRVITGYLGARCYFGSPERIKRRLHGKMPGQADALAKGFQITGNCSG